MKTRLQNLAKGFQSHSWREQIRVLYHGLLDFLDSVIAIQPELNLWACPIEGSVRHVIGAGQKGELTIGSGKRP
jgi:hypothetical protein